MRALLLTLGYQACVLMNRLPFYKIESVGNNFVLVDAINLEEICWTELAVYMCAHHFGVGADGLLVVLPTETSDFCVRMFNPDGTEDVSGNGLLCASIYAQYAGVICKPLITIEAKDGLHSVEFTSNTQGCHFVRLGMGVPSTRAIDIPAILDTTDVLDYPLPIAGEVYQTTVVQTGSPHAVIFARLEDFWEEIPAISAAIESLPIFPERINVTWCAVKDSEIIHVRTWERAVGPTLGCGTGACAAFFAAHIKSLVGNRACVVSPGGTLQVELDATGKLFLSGTPRIVFFGEWLNTPW